MSWILGFIIFVLLGNIFSLRRQIKFLTNPEAATQELIHNLETINKLVGEKYQVDVQAIVEKHKKKLDNKYSGNQL